MSETWSRAHCQLTSIRLGPRPAAFCSPEKHTMHLADNVSDFVSLFKKKKMAQCGEKNGLVRAATLGKVGKVVSYSW